MPGVWAGGDCIAGGEDLTVLRQRRTASSPPKSIHRALSGG